MNQPENTHSQHKVTLITALVILWLAGSLFGLWWFQQQAVRPFVEAFDNPSARNLNLVSEKFSHLYAQLPQSATHSVTIIHLWNPDCLCNNVSARHTQAILDAFPPEQLNFFMLAPATTSDQQIEEAETLNPRATILRQSIDSDIPLTASPALAVFTPAGKMAYFGAYGFGALCSLSDDSLFTNMVTRLLEGESYGPFLNIAGSGCFCAWPTTDLTNFPSNQTQAPSK